MFPGVVEKKHLSKIGLKCVQIDFFWQKIWNLMKFWATIASTNLLESELALVIFLKVNGNAEFLDH